MEYKPHYRFIGKIIYYLWILASFIAVVSLISEYGFYLSPEWESILHGLDLIIVWFFVLQALIKLFFVVNIKEYLKSRWFEYLLVFIIILQTIVFVRVLGVQALGGIFSGRELVQITKLYIVLFQVSILFTLLIQAVRLNQQIAAYKLHPAQVLLLSFFIIILIGTGLLLLPRSVAPGNQLSFIDALFTATSATCVTGLIVVDTGSHFSLMGQVIILILIQIGGLGLMTYSSFFALILRRSITLKEKSLLREILNYENMGLISRLLTYTIGFTFLLELIGAGFFFIGLKDVHPDIPTRIYSAIFHSISAFCNAGFSLYSTSFMGFLDNYLVLFTLMLLIVIGGLGFPVLLNLSGFSVRSAGERRRILTVQSRLVLIISGTLIFLGALVFFILENQQTLAGMPLGQKIAHSFFQSITTRTAGFNTVDISRITLPVALFFLPLMFIGASPGSTGGGIKTTTIGILTAGVLAVMRGRNRIDLFHKNVPYTVLNRALLILLFSLAFLFFVILVLSITEAQSLIDIVFEAFSAFGTVGLSRGITPHLSSIGKFVIILTMFFGRLGALTISLAISAPREAYHFDYPKENVMVG